MVPGIYSNYAPRKEQKKDARHRKPCKCLAGAGRRMEDGKPVPIKPDGSHCSGCPYIDDNDSYYKGNFGNEACKKHKKCEKGYGSVEFPRRDKDSVGKKYSDYVSLTDKCHDDYDKKKYEVITENGVNI